MRKALWAALAANVLLASACSDDGQPTSPPDTQPVPPAPVATAKPREREIRGGRIHDVMISGVTDAASADPKKLIDAVQADLRGRLGAVKATDFAEVHRNVAPAKGGARLAFVTMKQTVGGVPVDDTYLHVGVRYSAAGAKLVSSSYHLFENVPVDTNPSIPKDRALLIAQTDMRLRAKVAPTATALVIHRLDGHLQLAWTFTFPGSFKRAYVVASGAEKGRLYAIDQRVYETTGTVSGSVVHGGAPMGAGVVQTNNLGNTAVAGGGVATSADPSGAYTISVPGGTTLTASLSGKASVVNDTDGPALTGTGTAVDGGVTDLSVTGATEYQLAQVAAYYYVDQVHNFLVDNGMDPALFGAPLPTNTNLNETCNAYYDPGARNINFFKSGGGCNNSAIDTVIAHEYGHFVDDFNGGIQDGGLSEGWGDLLACLWNKQPGVGEDLFPGGAPLRSCQNTYIYTPGDEVHNLGQAWMGFGWDVRTNLMASLGPSGDDLARALILPSFQSNAPDIVTAVREVFLRDDDDGDITNKTPHWDALYAAAQNHGLAFAVEGDLTAPAPVTDLAITTATATQVALQWTATGDDGNVGTATSYELRWSTSPIDASNFSQATLVPTSAPKPAGSVETAIVSVLPETTIYVALRVSDEQNNTSTLSNVATVTTPTGTVVWQDGFEGDTSGWTATGLWHVTSQKASEGSHSFWYGQELTDNYDTGAANSGDLTSPIIDLSTASGPLLALDQFISVEALPQYDLANITVTDVNDPTHTLSFAKDATLTPAFQPRMISLNGFDGKLVRLTFHFDTVDNIANGTEGWFLDHLRIIASDSCAHSLCTTGGPLDASCSTCVATVCTLDPFCCSGGWDSLCQQEAVSNCGITCTTCGNGTCEAGETPTNCPQDCKPACAHDVCDPGVPLDAACDSCAGSICATDSFCCTVFWDRVCVQEAETTCGKVCQGCTHDLCNVGDPLKDNCDACATSVCAGDPYCCTTQWDSRCVQEAANGCGLQCQVCSHSLCTQGTALETSCDPCVGAVCGADPYCCSNTWDQRCIDESQTTCGLTCANAR